MPAIAQRELQEVLQTHPDALRVLVTGFGPFRRFPENPSWLAAKPLQNTLLFTPDDSSTNSETTSAKPARPIIITAFEIPTEYDVVLSTIPGIHARPPILPSFCNPENSIPPPEGGYDFVFHVGVAARDDVRLEKLAHKTGYYLPDANGKYAPSVETSSDGHELRGFGTGYEEFDNVLHTDIDVDAVVDYVQKQGLESMFAYDDPGHYLCDFIYYCSLAESKRTADKLRREGTQSKHTKVLFFHCPPVGQPLSIPEVTDAILKTVSCVCSEC